MAAIRWPVSSCHRHAEANKSPYLARTDRQEAPTTSDCKIKYRVFFINLGYCLCNSKMRPCPSMLQTVFGCWEQNKRGAAANAAQEPEAAGWMEVKSSCIMKIKDAARAILQHGLSPSHLHLWAALPPSPALIPYTASTCLSSSLYIDFLQSQIPMEHRLLEIRASLRLSL